MEDNIIKKRVTEVRRLTEGALTDQFTQLSKDSGSAFKGFKPGQDLNDEQVGLVLEAIALEDVANQQNLHRLPGTLPLDLRNAVAAVKAYDLSL